MDKKSNICCGNNKCCNSSKTLRTISTGNVATTDTNTVADLLDDDEDNHLHKNECEDFSTFLQEWDAFYLKYVNSPTYALAHSSADSNMTSTIIDDADDDNRSMSYSSDQPATSYEASLWQLNQAAR